VTSTADVVLMCLWLTIALALWVRHLMRGTYPPGYERRSDDGFIVDPIRVPEMRVITMPHLPIVVTATQECEYPQCGDDGCVECPLVDEDPV
jgi:hypothetical protein